jgi:hypothetical protein
LYHHDEHSKNYTFCPQSVLYGSQNTVYFPAQY